MSDETHTLDELKAIVHELEGRDDPNEPSDENDPSFRAAVVLLAAAEQGAKLVPLIRFTGYHAEWMAMVDKNLRASEIWVDERTSCDWFDEDHGGIDFWIDVNVALGLMEKAPAADG